MLRCMSLKLDNVENPCSRSLMRSEKGDFYEKLALKGLNGNLKNCIGYIRGPTV